MANGSRTIFNTIMLAATTAILASSANVWAEADPAMIAEGEKLYKRERCETCHGGNLQGSAAFPSLVTSTAAADKAQFTNIVTNGKGGGMPAFSGNAKVIGGIDALYEFVRSRSTVGK